MPKWPDWITHGEAIIRPEWSLFNFMIAVVFWPNCLRDITSTPSGQQGDKTNNGGKSLWRFNLILSFLSQAEILIAPQSSADHVFPGGTIFGYLQPSHSICYKLEPPRTIRTVEIRIFGIKNYPEGDRAYQVKCSWQAIDIEFHSFAEAISSAFSFFCKPTDGIFHAIIDSFFYRQVDVVGDMLMLIWRWVLVYGCFWRVRKVLQGSWAKIPSITQANSFDASCAGSNNPSKPNLMDNQIPLRRIEAENPTMAST